MITIIPDVKTTRIDVGPISIRRRKRRMDIGPTSPEMQTLAASTLRRHAWLTRLLQANIGS